MNRTAQLVLFAMIGMGAARAVLAQIAIQPTPAPTVTAEAESWYVTNEPLVFAGNQYYPGGPSIHFLPNEMVLSGFFRGIPLYTRTTIEPYSVVFVPVVGGMMRPYERRRSGDLVGTTGSSVSTLPVEIPTAFSAPSRVQAAAPPFVETRGLVTESIPPEPPQASQGANSGERQPQTTSGRVGTASRPTKSRATNKRVGRPPANAIFIEFNNQRWFASAPPRSIDAAASLQRIGEWHGFPVYTSRNTGPSTIYVPVAQGSDAYVAYSRK